VNRGEGGFRACVKTRGFPLPAFARTSFAGMTGLDRARKSSRVTPAQAGVHSRRGLRRVFTQTLEPRRTEALDLVIETVWAGFAAGLKPRPSKACPTGFPQPARLKDQLKSKLQNAGISGRRDLPHGRIRDAVIRRIEVDVVEEVEKLGAKL
jgi:hypothetical protein